MPKEQPLIAIPIQKLQHAQDLALPSYATMHSAGMDLYAAIPPGEELLLYPMQRIPVSTGIAIALPVGLEAQVRPRSGLAFKHGVTIINAPGTIDADYRGEIFVLLVNLGQENFVIKRGLRIAQLVIAQYIVANWNIMEELQHTERGSNGFGSTGLY